MAESRAAARYAKALLDLAVESNVLEEVHADMQLFVRTCEENRSLLSLWQSPIVSHLKKMAVLRELFQSRVHPVSYSVFEIITRKNREKILLDVARTFHGFYNQYKGIQEATVITTFPIDENLRSQFKDMVRKASGKQGVELTEKVDEQLIGGFLLQVGDRQIDESVKGKLQRLRQDMTKA